MQIHFSHQVKMALFSKSNMESKIIAEFIMESLKRINIFSKYTNG